MPKTVTLRHIAEVCNVSAKTVSYVIGGRPGASVSEETRTRVLAEAQRLGYARNWLAWALRKGRMNAVGIVCPFDLHQPTDTGRYTYAKNLMHAITIAAACRRLNTTFFVDSTLQTLPPSDVTDRRVDGIILLDLCDHEEWVRSIYASGHPCVEVGSSFGRYSVNMDNRRAAYDATMHLIQLGHRRIAHWYGGDDAIPAEERKAGFVAAASAACLSEADTLIFHSAAELEALLRRQDHPTGLFAYNDEYAVRALDCIHDAGLRVPDDVSLVGFDDDLRAICMRPRLTTVQLPLDSMAQTAVDLLTAQIDGEEKEETAIVFPAPLVVRETTSAQR